MINVAVTVLALVIMKWMCLRISVVFDVAGSRKLIVSAWRSFSSTLRGPHDRDRQTAGRWVSASGYGGEAQPYSDLDQIGEGIGLHLLHHSTPMRLHGDFTDPKFAAHLFVRESGNYQG
jgi:hypothetical protein